ncbi:hypothetical protein FXO37_23580 [Capsicum annuum]|nr:hypothetical protein FXO37_23580 [Capsicum annuum]
MGPFFNFYFPVLACTFNYTLAFWQDIEILKQLKNSVNSNSIAKASHAGRVYVELKQKIMLCPGRDEVLDRITDGPTIPMKMVEGEQVKKVRSEFTPDDLLALKKNEKAKNILVCGLGPTEYNRVSTCTTAKQIWDALVNAHEGTSQVRKFSISLLFTEYEAFKMKENETLHEIMTRLTTLTNELTSLGKIISGEEQVEKVLRVLPRSKWNVKVTAIREANKELEGIPLDELVGKLRTYEMEIDGMKEQAASEKILALKTSDGDEDFELDKEQVAFITKNFSKFFKKKKGTGTKNHSNDNPNVAKLIIRSETVQSEKYNERKKGLKRN